MRVGERTRAQSHGHTSEFFLLLLPHFFPLRRRILASSERVRTLTENHRRSSFKLFLFVSLCVCLSVSLSPRIRDKFGPGAKGGREETDSDGDENDGDDAPRSLETERERNARRKAEAMASKEEVRTRYAAAVSSNRGIRCKLVLDYTAGQNLRRSPFCGTVRRGLAP